MEARKIDQIELRNRFEYHGPPEGVAQVHRDVRKDLQSVTIRTVENLPPGREAALFVTKMEEAMFWANAAIARNHDHYNPALKGD
jgi:hypothetical protein